MLGNLRISLKLLGMVGLAFAGIVAIALLWSDRAQGQPAEDRKTKLRDLVKSRRRRSIANTRTESRPA